MPLSQKLALNCNSRWRFKGSKFDSIPFVPVPSVWNRLKIREIYMGQYQTFILNISAGNYNWQGQGQGQGQGPLFKGALFENGAESQNFTNLFFVTSHFGTIEHKQKSQLGTTE